VAGVPDLKWMADALCRDHPEIDFHPVDSASAIAPIRICHQCPVEDDCLEYALATHQDHGVWGGVSERERIRIRRSRNRSPEPSGPALR
jgi:WhiB family redox-sensing transcriptional regulator